MKIYLAMLALLTASASFADLTVDPIPAINGVSTNQTNGTQQTEINNGTNVAAVKAASTAAVGADPALVVAVSANNTVAVTQSTSPWVDNVSQFGGNNVVTGTGNSGVGIPRVTVSNDSSITNISGTVSLPTGASTSANQTNASQKTQLVDGSGTVIGAASTVGGVNYLPVYLSSSGAEGAAVPTRTALIGGEDTSNNLQPLRVDTSGNLIVIGSVASGTSDSGNPVEIGAKYESSQTSVTTGERSVLHSTKFGDMTTGDNTSFTNISTATTTTVKSGAGLLYAICWNKQVNNATDTIYDNPAGSGTLIGTITEAQGGGANFPAGCQRYNGMVFSTGLTIVTSGASNLTVLYK